MKTAALLILLSTSVFAHDDHDWRLDYEAYLNVTTEVRPMNKMRHDTAPKRISMEFFKEKLAVFASRNRKTNEDLDQSREFLSEEYKKLGFEVSLHPFGTGTNFIAEKKRNC